MKSSNIPENTQGNKEGLVQWLNDNYTDNQPWVLLGPGIGENRGYPCTLAKFEKAGVYIDLRLATDKFGFNVLGVQPWHFYEKGEYRDAMEWLITNRKPSKIITNVLSLGGHGFFNYTSPEDAEYVMLHSDELHVIVTGPPIDHKTYREDVIKVVAASGKPIFIYSSANDTKDGTSYIHSQTLHDQLKAEGANVTITMFSPGYGHNGTATHVWSDKNFYKWAQSVPQHAPVPATPPVVVTEPTTAPVEPPTIPPVVTTPPEELKKVRIGAHYFFNKNGVQMRVQYSDGTQGPILGIGNNIWVPDSDIKHPTITPAKGPSKHVDAS